jgi:hypothetical protein
LWTKVARAPEPTRAAKERWAALPAVHRAHAIRIGVTVVCPIRKSPSAFWRWLQLPSSVCANYSNDSSGLKKLWTTIFSHFLKDLVISCFFLWLEIAKFFDFALSISWNYFIISTLDSHSRCTSVMYSAVFYKFFRKFSKFDECTFFAFVIFSSK